MLDPWTLRVMVEVVERGSFSAAAEALTMTQPAVSRQIGGLERRLGVSLFRRLPRGVEPTPAGEIAAEQARDILARLRDLEVRLGTFASLDAGTLRIAAHASANTAFMPEVIRRFGRAHPGISLSLTQVASDATLTAVRTGRVDLALLTEWSLYADLPAARTDPSPEPLGPAALAGLDLVPLLDERFQVALPVSHPLAAHRRVRLSDLRDETWIEGGHPDCLGPIPRLTEALAGTPRIGFFCEDWNGKQALVAGGSGITLVPTLAQGVTHPGVTLRPTVPELPGRRLYSVSTAPPFRYPAVEAMLNVLTEAAREYAPPDGSSPGRQADEADAAQPPPKDSG
ncbi:LysR family transcriptional regulator [Actinomadura sp. SCN-SB]|uniref:LysR family transcriptional regulator n=1 Tax=Actinomadura sp. SCN-SB TaxID=3373092 RepID=UPI003750B78C